MSSMTDAAKVAENSDLTFRRRDMLETEKVAGVPFGKMFYEETGPDGKTFQVTTATGMLAMQYVVEKRNGMTNLSFDDWLDGEAEGFEVTVGDDPS